MAAGVLAAVVAGAVPGAGDPAEPELVLRAAFALPVHDLAFTRDGDWLIARGERPGSEAAWELTSGRRVPDAPAVPGTARTEAFSPRVDWHARGRPDGAVELLDTKTFEAAHVLAGHQGPVNAVAFDPAGARLASASEDGEAIVWDLERFAPLHRLRHDSPVTGLVFAADGRTLVTAAGDGAVRAWDPQTGEPRGRLAQHDGPALALAFSADGSLLASGGAAGAVRIRDMRRGREIAILASMRNGDGWLAADPAGHFDGSPDALRRLALWRSGDNAVSLDALVESWLRPGLLAELLAGRGPSPPREIAEIDLRPPRIDLRLVERRSLEQGGAAVRLEVEVTHAPATAGDRQGSGVRDLRLYRNETLAEEWPGPVLAGGRSSRVLHADLRVPEGTQRFTARARNRDGVAAAEASLVVPGRATDVAPRTARVLTIGINQYSNGAFNLRYAMASARNSGDVLAEQLRRHGGFGDVQRVALSNKEATRTAILAALDQLAGVARPDDAVFVFFSGHGIARGDRFHLLSHDLGYAGPRSKLDATGVKSMIGGGLSDVDLGRAFGKMEAGWLVLVIDACEPAPQPREHGPDPGPMGSRGLALLAHDAGAYVLAATQGYRAALDASEGGHGLLAYALIDEGLRTLAADRPPANGMVELREWLAYPQDRVPALQRARMQQSRRPGNELAFVDGEETIADAALRSVRRPRLFYPASAGRRRPLVVARPGATASP